VRRQGLACRFVGRLWLAGSLLFEAIEQTVDVHPVENHAGTLAHGHELRAPHFIESTALDADVIHGFLVGQAAFDGHSFAIVSDSAWTSVNPAATKD